MVEAGRSLGSWDKFNSGWEYACGGTLLKTASEASFCIARGVYSISPWNKKCTPDFQYK